MKSRIRMATMRMEIDKYKIYIRGRIEIYTNSWKLIRYGRKKKTDSEVMEQWH